MHPTLTIAKRAALAAAKIITRGSQQLDSLKPTEKAKNDYVSSIDLASELEIVNIIKDAFPEHDILSEESGHIVDNNSEYLWVIDPLDGTTNFLKGFPYYSISIAVLHNNKPISAVVYNPISDEMFIASRGDGARLNDKKIRASKTLPENAIIATGIPFKDEELMPKQLSCLRDVLNTFPDIRRTGSAALDLCYVAAGRVDGFYELGLQKWDIAAGALIAQESGAIISDITGELTHLESGHIVAAPQKVYKELIRITRSKN